MPASIFSETELARLASFPEEIPGDDLIGQLLGSDGRVNRRSFELCVLYPLRDGLRSGAIWLQGSRRFADPATYLIPSSQWTSRRSEALRIS